MNEIMILLAVVIIASCSFLIGVNVGEMKFLKRLRKAVATVVKDNGYEWKEKDAKEEDV